MCENPPFDNVLTEMCKQLLPPPQLKGKPVSVAAHLELSYKQGSKSSHRVYFAQNRIKPCKAESAHAHVCKVWAQRCAQPHSALLGMVLSLCDIPGSKFCPPANQGSKLGEQGISSHSGVPRMKQKSAGCRESSTGRCADTDQLPFSPSLIHAFGLHCCNRVSSQSAGPSRSQPASPAENLLEGLHTHYQLLGGYFHLIYCFTSLLQFVLTY